MAGAKSEEGRTHHPLALRAQVRYLRRLQGIRVFVPVSMCSSHLEMTNECKLSALSSVEIAGYKESLTCKVDTDGDTGFVGTPSK